MGLVITGSSGINGTYGEPLILVTTRIGIRRKSEETLITKSPISPENVPGSLNLSVSAFTSAEGILESIVIITMIIIHKKLTEL